MTSVRAAQNLNDRLSQTTYDDFGIAENDYKLLVENLPEAYSLLEILPPQGDRRIDYRWILVNRSFERLTGIPNDDVVGMRLREVFNGWQLTKFIHAMNHTATTGSSTQFEGYHPEMGIFYEFVALRPRQDRLAVVFRDISTRRETEDKVLLRFEILEETVQERTRELREANQQLRAEMLEHRKTEKALEKANEDLQAERRSLAEKNVVLKGVLDQISNEKQEIGNQVQANVDKVIMPILRMIGPRIDDANQHHVRLLEHSLSDIASPFVDQIERRFQALAPRELEVCNMIKNGMTTKQISSILHTSIETVNSQRKSIRRKLGISKSGRSLTLFLKSN